MVYISLQEASSICPYSQEYLSLRARQRKLKAVKLGRNWACTKEWLDEYIAKAERSKSDITHVEPPRNLPIYAPDAEMWEEDIPLDIARQREFQRKFQFAFAVAFVAALFFGSMFQGREHVIRAAERVSPVVISSALLFQETLQAKGFALGNEAQSHFGAGVGEIAKNYISWLGERVRSIAKIFRPDANPAAEVLPRAPAVREVELESRGLVVVPLSASEADDEKIKAQIQQSFSDEVRVFPHDDESGIITPVFRHRIGEDYLYILVPVRDEKAK